MVSNKMKEMVNKSSAIRAMFEEGQKMAAKVGAENVFDFSLGNPSIPSPPEVNKAILGVLEEEDSLFVHGYMNNAGFPDVRKKVADHLNGLYGTEYTEKHILMTVGAAGGMNVVLKVILNPGDEVLTLMPFFGEYRSYVANFDGVLVPVPTDPSTFMPIRENLEKAITAKTRAMIINSPNNPSGVVYGEADIAMIAEVLKAKEEEYGAPIYLISDEPYRELVYDGVKVPWIPNYYKNTIVGYSFSKTLSMPGERIGYLAFSPEVDGLDEMLPAASIANRILGFVNAPSLMQRAIARLLDAKTDLAGYEKNRKAIYEGLTNLGFTCIEPQGSFFLFIKSPIEDDEAFCEAAKKYNILIVPGVSFGGKGYARLAYCVAYDTIIRALPGFAKLAEEFGLK